jgi:hypothetical protein
MHEEFIKKLLAGKKSDTNVIDQLYKVPKRDKNGDNTTFTRVSPGYYQYLDTLYLPNDKGYIYALVLTDQGNRYVDVEPMKDRKSSDIVKALKAIYKRKILKKPKMIITDAGSEFKKDFDIALEDMKVQHKTSKSGRHRSLALVERKNQTIGKVIHKMLVQTELSSGNASSEWVSYIKKLVKFINEKVEEKNEKIKVVPVDKQDITFNKKKKVKTFNVGDKVRVALDNPRDLNGKPLNGKFRSSDIRFDPKIRTIMYVLYEPLEPIMYLLDGKDTDMKIEKVGYTYNQLQAVSGSENKTTEPVLDVEENRYEIKKILKRRKKGKSYEYYVHWKADRNNMPKTWEKRKDLVEDLGKSYMDKTDIKFDKLES